MKRIILLVVICCLGKFLFAQDTIRMECEGKDFAGIWVAIQDSSTYEVNLHVQFVRDDTLKCDREYIIGTIKKITNETVEFFWETIRKEGHFFAPLMGEAKDSRQICMNCHDQLAHRNGKLTFTLADSKNTATWKLKPDEMSDFVSSTFPAQPFKLPEELTFTRKK